jgi:hypothetical protein
MIRPLERLLSMREAAEFLGICERTLREHTKSGAIAYVVVGRGSTRQHRMFHVDDLRTFIDARRRQECPLTAQPAGRTTSTISKSEVVDFPAIRAARQSAKLTPTKSASSRKPPKR